MMRLIDADMLLSWFESWNDNDEFSVGYIKGLIDEAVKAGAWIPCAERVPEDTDYVLCTTETKKGIRQVVRGYFMPDLKQWVCGMNSNVVAWMPLPERYRGDESAK